MPTAKEIEQFNEFRERENVQDSDAGSYPIITYLGPVEEDALNLDGTRTGGQHVRAYALGLYYDVPSAILPRYMFNMNYGPDKERFKTELPTVRWNGIWIHQGHGHEGDLTNKRMKIATFYEKWAKPLFQQDKFQYGLMKTCYAARRAEGDSAIEQLANLHQAKNVILYGANAITWIPLAGKHLGCPSIKPLNVYYNNTENFREYYNFGNSSNAALDHAENCMGDDCTWSDMVPYLTDAYYKLVGFTPERAIPISQNDKGSNPDINWYGTGI